MPSPESFVPEGCRPDIRLYVEPPDEVPDEAEGTVTEEVAKQRADFEAAMNKLWMRRQAQIDSIRTEALADIAGGGRITEKTLNRMRNFKEEWQDFFWGDLIAYDDVFEDSDHG